MFLNVKKYPDWDGKQSVVEYTKNIAEALLKPLSKKELRMLPTKRSQQKMQNIGLNLDGKDIVLASPPLQQYNFCGESEQ